MSARTASDAFAAATAALVTETDTAGILANVLADTVEVLLADSVGLLVYTPRRSQLELLSSSSHVATELELYQLQHDTGPCLEVMHSHQPVVVSLQSGLRDRWPPVGAAIAAAGFMAVHAYPLRWRGRAIGALNAFYAGEIADEADPRGQMFADIATLVVTQQRELSEPAISARIDEALRGRIVIEQAKGVIAYRESVDIAQSYVWLRSMAADRGVTLTEAARLIIDQAQDGPAVG
jgi:hypothetical protein